MDSPTNSMPADNGRSDAKAKTKITSAHAEGSAVHQSKFGFWTLLGYQITITSCWANYLLTIGVSIDVGGPVGFLYGTLVVGFFQLLTAMSLSELVSVWPHPGGALFWIIELAPTGKGRGFAFFMGWINVLSYATGVAAVGFASTQAVTALVTILTGFEWQRWQLCLVFWGFALSYVPASLRPSWLPIWSILSIVFLMGMLIVTIGLWSSHIQLQSAEFVFLKFTNNTGWSNSVVVFFLSLVQATFATTGLEAATHMSLETINPRSTIPRVMMSAVAFSALVCFSFSILMLYSLGDLDRLMESSLGEIYLQLYVNAAGRAGGLAVATVLMVVMTQFTGTQGLAAIARVVWALGCVGWVPFASTFAKTNPKTTCPVNATLLTIFLSMLCGLLYIASETAWNAIVSCVVSTYQATYIAPIIVLMIRGRSVLPERSFNLDLIPGLGYVINAITVLWGIFVIILSLFPVYLPATGETMNYSIVVLGICGIFLGVYWALFARHRSTGDGAERALVEMIH